MIKLLILNTIKLFYYDIKFTRKILGNLVFTPLAVYTAWFTLRGLRCAVYSNLSNLSNLPNLSNLSNLPNPSI